jgi:hypothetical protein
MDAGCKKAIDDMLKNYEKGTVADFASYAGATYYNSNDAAVADRTLGQLGDRSSDQNLTVTQFFANYPNTVAITPGAQAIIILGSLYQSVNAAAQSWTLIHENLHAFTGFSDDQLAADFGLYGYSSGHASEALNSFLNSPNCTKKGP